MTVRDQLDPELYALIEGQPARKLTEQSLAEFRLEAEQRRAALPSLGIEPQFIEVPALGLAPAVQVLIYRPPPPR